MSSVAGFRGRAGFGVYNSSKFALEGFSEALAMEVAPLGIKVTIVKSGAFRTNFAKTGIKKAARSIEDYATTAGAFIEALPSIHSPDNKEKGDPEKAASVIIEVVNADAPPLHLPLGKPAFAAIKSKLDAVKKELSSWEEVASKTSFYD